MLDLRRIESFKKHINKKRLRSIIFVIGVFIFLLFNFIKPTFSGEELMLCDDCIKHINMEYNGEVFTNITLRYEWPD